MSDFTKVLQIFGFKTFVSRNGDRKVRIECPTK